MKYIPEIIFPGEEDLPPVISKQETTEKFIKFEDIKRSILDNIRVYPSLYNLLNGRGESRIISYEIQKRKNLIIDYADLEELISKVTKFKKSEYDIDGLNGIPSGAKLWSLKKKVENRDKKAIGITNFLTERNLRWVIKRARKYYQSHYPYTIPLLDLVQEDSIGLRRAVHRFDYTRGGTLTTYSTYWINQTMDRANKDTLEEIRQPVHFQDMNRKLVKKLKESEGKNLQKIIEESDLSLDAKSLHSIYLKKREAREVRLNQEIENDDGTSSQRGVFIEDEGAEKPSECKNKQIEDIRYVLTLLPPKEEKIMRMRFGINPDKYKGVKNDEHTLEEVGEKFGVTRERIRQIEEKILRKLKPIMKERGMSP